MIETWHYTRRDGERCTLTYDPETGEATNPTLGNRKNIKVRTSTTGYQWREAT